MPNPNPYRARDRKLKRQASVPRRERWLIQQVLDGLHVRYWQAITIWNPLFTGQYDDKQGGWQWLDFVLRAPFGPAVLMFDMTYGSGRPHLHEKRAILQKQAFLESKGIPYMTLSRMHPLDEYKIKIEFWLRKETRKRSTSRPEGAASSGQALPMALERTIEPPPNRVPPVEPPA